MAVLLEVAQATFGSQSTEFVKQEATSDVFSCFDWQRELLSFFVWCGVHPNTCVMMNLFGKKKAAPKMTVNQSIGQMKETVNAIDKRREYLEKQAKQCQANAIAKNKVGDKQGAMFELKRKKLLEKQTATLWAQRCNLEQTVMSIESADTAKQTYIAMKIGAEQMQQQKQELDPDKVNDVADQVSELMQDQDEVAEAMARPIGQPVDETELEDELNQLDEQAVDSKILEMNEASPTAVKEQPQAAKVKAPAAAVAIGAAPMPPASKPAAAAPKKTAKEIEEEKQLAELMGA